MAHNAGDHLEKQFEDALGRLTGKTPPFRTSYGDHPLASDHDLLRRSWDYFKRRLRVIEAQWQDISQSKETRAKSLEAELNGMRERLRELEDENHDLRAFEETVRRKWVADRRNLERDCGRVRERWEDEVDALARERDRLERDLNRSKNEIAALEEKAAAATAATEERIARLQKELSDRLASQKGLQDLWTKTEAETGDRMSEMERKIDLLRADLARRDEAYRQSEEARRAAEKERQALQRQVAELKNAVVEGEKELDHRTRRVRALETEMETMKRIWESERSQWRELWDRERVLQERRRTGPDGPNAA